MKNINFDFCIVPYFSHPADLVSRFDSPICQVWIDTDRSEIETTEMCKELLDKKILGYYPEITTDEHLGKLNKKFPDFYQVPLAHVRKELTENKQQIPF